MPWVRVVGADFLNQCVPEGSLEPMSLRRYWWARIRVRVATKLWIWASRWEVDWKP